MLVYDHTWLAQPNLLIPGKKPVGPVVVDRSNEFGRHLVHLFIGPDRDLVTGQSTTITGTVNYQTVNGERWIYIADNGYFSFSLNEAAFAAQEGTLFFELKNNSTSNNQSNLHDLTSNTSMNHRVYSNKVYDNAFSSVQNISGVAPAITVTNPGFFIITSKSGTNGMSLVEGATAGSLATTTSVTRTGWGIKSTVRIGASSHASTLTYDWVGWIKHVFILNKAFDVDALNRLSLDPYQCLRPA